MKARSAPSLSERAKAPQHSQPTSVEGDEGGGSGRPTRRWEMTEGAPDAIIQKRLSEIVNSQFHTICTELDEHDSQSFCSDNDCTKASITLRHAPLKLKKNWETVTLTPHSIKQTNTGSAASTHHCEFTPVPGLHERYSRSRCITEGSGCISAS